jgi:hypothetical protein
MDAGIPAPRIGVARRWSEIYGATWVVFGDSSGDDPAPRNGGKEKMNGYLDLFLLRPVGMGLQRPQPAYPRAVELQSPSLG